MILTSSWDISVNTTASYEYYNSQLPSSYTAKIYDKADAGGGNSIPEIVNIVRSIGDTSTVSKITNGVYASITMKNAYDVILLDTIKRITT